MFGKKKTKGNEAQARKLFLKDAQKKDYYPTSVSRSLLTLSCLTFLPQVGFTQTIALDGSKKLYLNNVVVETVKHRENSSTRDCRSAR